MSQPGICIVCGHDHTLPSQCARCPKGRCTPRIDRGLYPVITIMRDTRPDRQGTIAAGGTR